MNFLKFGDLRIETLVAGHSASAARTLEKLGKFLGKPNIRVNAAKMSGNSGSRIC